MTEQKKRFNSMAQEYDSHAPIIVPNYNELQEVICQIIENSQKNKIRVMDIGAGSGILMKKIADRFDSECTIQDFSEEFIKIAKEKLKGKKAEFVISDLASKEWNKNIKPGFDVIVSSIAIHHLQDERKKELYKEIFEMLNKGGVFINGDEIRGESEPIYFMYLKHWSDYFIEKCKKGEVSEKMTEVLEKYVERNITNFGKPDPNPKDIHCGMVKQIQWLQEAGFKGSECFWKKYLFAVFGGFKE
jgi:tRNA (cmo5U34)-methyltransferase